jgi:hypothetical protein
MEITPRYIHVSEESADEFKRIFKKPDGTTFTGEEAHEAAQNLIGFFDFLVRLDDRNKREGRYEEKWRLRHCTKQ